jgi:hypothetical protein
MKASEYHYGAKLEYFGFYCQHGIGPPPKVTKSDISLV